MISCRSLSRIAPQPWKPTPGRVQIVVLLRKFLVTVASPSTATSCVTEHSYMLRVVHRGCMNDQLTWYPGYADFVRHGQSVPSLPAIFSGRHLRAILRGEQFNFIKLPPAKNRASKSIADWFSLIEEITQLSAMQELFAWFRAGYIPVSMAAARRQGVRCNVQLHPTSNYDCRRRRFEG
jgi:hypothetical protein